MTVPISQDSARLRLLKIELPNHWHGSEESVWAMPIADDLYEIRNVPHMAYGLNFLDVVYAERAPMLEACIRRVVRRSGHRTLRCIFLQNLSETQQAPWLEEIMALGASVERASANYVCIDVHPGSSLAAIQARLETLERDGILEYETCEERVPGSFDDSPEAPEARGIASVGNAR